MSQDKFFLLFITTIAPSLILNRVEKINNFIGKPARLWKTPVDIIKISVKFCTALFLRQGQISHPVTTCAAPPRSPPMLASRGKPEESALPPSLVCKLQRGSERRAGLPPPRQWAPFVRPNPSRRTDDGRFCWLKACWSWQNVEAAHERHLSMVCHSRERIVHICRFPWRRQQNNWCSALIQASHVIEEIECRNLLY